MDSYKDSLNPVDMDDNAFYQELTRQILMLTDEDDDEKRACTSDRPVVYSGVGYRPVARSHYNWSETESSSVPTWMERLWANGGGGTGVFIPSGVTTRGYGKRSRRRYNNKATKTNDRGRVYSSAGQKIHG